ncbi:MAG: beta-galactosidase [Armatimonadota bacterium]|nr:beta-galactosidase [Armatimonadota bacterium]
MAAPLPPFPYGAVYYRKSNPPQSDWERDYATAAEDGMNVFRHWFLWSAVEVSPGVFDWSDYDRHLDLAAKQGIKTIVAEMITAAPEWAFRSHAHARYETRDGRKVCSGMSPSCVTGGFPGLCYDNEDARALAGRFLAELAARYKEHPGLGGYDVWNECNYSPDTCYCPATAALFRRWLREKYGDLRTLGEAWHRHSYAEWDDVEPPRALGPYPDVLDWLRFRLENAYRLMRWRVEVIRGIDPVHPITAHGIAGTLTGLAGSGADDWRAAAEVESYGYTWGSCRHGDEPWKQYHAVDLVRAACRGKRFWHAEAYAGPLWMASNVLNKPRDEGRIASPEDVRFWDMVSFAAGATGLMYLRWRPLLDGPLFGAFGAYGMDGSRTPRSEMAARVGKWTAAPQQVALWASRPVRGELALLILPETQLFTLAQQGDTGFFSQSLRGAYRAFFDANIQADWVRLPHLDEYDLVYLPFPVMMERESAEALMGWVEKGGTLVCEGCPAYFGPGGRAGTSQPNLGLDRLFGARESYVEFTPDLLNNLRFTVGGVRVPGGLFMQAYQPTSGTAVGWYDDGRVAAVENAFGRGRALLLGSMAGYGYGRLAGKGDPSLALALMEWAGKRPRVRVSDGRVTARLHAGEGGVFLWITNPVREPIPVRVELSPECGSFTRCQTHWGPPAKVEGRVVSLTVGARDAAVLRLV